jgi:catechol 2,3-dioxygenase-like lactoylglutathione lyase family enzyme
VLNRLGVISLWAQDFPRMLAFYRDVLLLPLAEMPSGENQKPGAEWARFELQGTRLELFALSRSPKRAARLPVPRQNAAVLCFVIDALDDFEAVQRDLATRGVAFEQSGQRDWGRFAHFRDPEGNELQIYQQNPGA